MLLWRRTRALLLGLVDVILLVVVALVMWFGQELEELVNGIDAMWPSFGSIRGLPMFPLFRVPGASGSVEGGEEGDVEFRSTVERELWFVSHHALHHNAMVYTIAAECSAEARDALPKTFGMAPATVDFMRSEAGN